MSDNELVPTTNDETKTAKKVTQIIQQKQIRPRNATDEANGQQTRMMIDADGVNMAAWLLTLNKLYDDRNYSSDQRINYTIPLLNIDQQTWYDQNQGAIRDDWKIFCEGLEQMTPKINPSQTTASACGISSSNSNVSVELETLIDTNFHKYSGVSDAKEWILQIMNQFKACGLRRENQLEAIPFLLEGEAYLWYADNVDIISNFELFCKLFLQEFKSTVTIPTRITTGTNVTTLTVPDNLSTPHLQRVVADDIIKRPTYFRGSQDDVHEWLDKLEQRFLMARWNDDDKLYYISVHLQDSAYRWWKRTSPTIKTWSSFKDTIIRAFDSTRTQELAFEQLKWYKQTTNQSVAQYYDKVSELCEKVDPTMPDPMKLKYLMAGIKESFKRQVALERPTTTEAFLIAARKIEDIFTLTDTNNALTSNDIFVSAANYRGQSTRINHSQSTNDKFNPSNSRRTHTQRNNPTYYQKSSSRNHASQQDKHHKNLKSTRRPGTCFNCGTPGHYVRDCTRPHFQ